MKAFRNSGAGNQQKHFRNTSTKTSGSRWKMNFCGIFCDPQKGSEAESKVCGYPSPSGGISGIRYVQVFQRIPKRILWFRTSLRQAGQGYRLSGSNTPRTAEMQKHLWIPKDAARLGGQRHLPKSQNCVESNEEV